MRRPQSRHHTEEELLLHYLGEETSGMNAEIAAHLLECGECDAIFTDYGNLVGKIRAWTVPEVPDEVWQAQKRMLLAQFRQDYGLGRRRGMIGSVLGTLGSAWNFALENPLPTLAYIAVAVAFALERTISTFRLDRILPGASEVFEILRQVF